MILASPDFSSLWDWINTIFIVSLCPWFDCLFIFASLRKCQAKVTLMSSNSNWLDCFIKSALGKQNCLITRSCVATDKTESQFLVTFSHQLCQLLRLFLIYILTKPWTVSFISACQRAKLEVLLPSIGLISCSRILTTKSSQDAECGLCYRDSLFRTQIQIILFQSLASLK